MGLLTITGAAAQDETDYDRDNDGLIEVADLAQLNAIRWDLDGDGAADDAAHEANYAAAFADPTTGMGCPSTGCVGYELTANLNFHGSTWASDPGWAPLAEYVDADSIPFTATFDGNGNDITNLYINRPAALAVGLFGYAGAGADIRNVRLRSVNVTGHQYVGGLVGLNSGGAVSNSQATGDVTGMDAGAENGKFVGGLVGYNYGGTISDSHASGTVTGHQNIGGLVGYNYGGTISDSHASGTVTGHQNIGGLVGYNYGGISDSHASGSVSGEKSIGGLAGVNYGVTISNSHATGRVTGTGTSELIGGLVGYNSGTISNSYATGAVTGDSEVGGLVGTNEGGTISTGHATGDVTGTDRTTNSGMIGGLVGWNLGGGSTIKDNSYATGAVTGHREVGGLVGMNTGAISTSHATGDVTGTETTFRSTQIGGLVGLNENGTISTSYATGTVTGSQRSGEYTGEHAGGLVGANQGGAIDASLSTGAVIGSDNIGGLVGANINSLYSIGTINTSYSTGSVTGARAVGGLVGVNYAAIRASYSTATVRAADGSAGGLVGANIHDVYAPDGPTGTIRASYSKGTVTGTTDVGGLVGRNDGGAIDDSYWDTETSGVTTSAGGTGKTTEELQTPTAYTDSDPGTEDIYANWNLDLDGDGSPDDPWEFGADSQYPALKIGVVADDNEPPEIASGSRTEFSFRENGTASLYTYRATDPEQADITWSLSGPDDGDFAIGENGALAFASPPDFENPTDADSDNVYNVTVVASDDRGNRDTLDIIVTVTDQNEGPEVSGQQSLSFSENQTTARVLASYSATDPEDPSAIITRWSLTGSDAGDFTISDNGELSFRQVPDYDRPADSGRDNVYNFSVRASDGRHYGYLPVTVSITDVNEPPTITTISTSATELRQDENRIARLYTYRATDPERGAIRWTVGGVDGSFFAIDDRGQFAFSESTPPNFEQPGDLDGNNVYEVEIQAGDGVSSDSLSVTVTVREVNEGPEVSGQSTYTISENQSLANAVYTATDPEGGNVTRWTLGGRDGGDFFITQGGTLFFKSLPDYERPADANGDNVYEVSIQPSDGRNTGAYPVIVTVTDVNEPPEIRSGSSTYFTQPENRTSRLFTYSAADPERGTVAWSVDGADASHFAIDERGQFSFNENTPPDFDSPGDVGGDNIYHVTVEARDDQRNTSSLPVTVTVTQVDEGPVITRQGNAPGGVQENHAVTQVLARYTASDPERPTVQVTRWSTAGRDGGDFVINALGELRFRKAPDYERPADANRDNVYEVTIRASDGRNTGTLEEVQRVTVTDVNEAPIITTTSRTAFSQAENRTSTLYTFRATDPEGGAVTWTATGSDGSHFTIDERGGFSFNENNPPDFDTPGDADRDNVYHVTVQARDAESNPASLDVAVTVTNHNEGVEPTISTRRPPSTYRENDTRAVYTFRASDPQRGAIQWSVTGTDAGDFAITGDSSGRGVLTFNDPPDFENPADGNRDNAYEIAVVATDDENHTDRVTFTITVSDHNEGVEPTISTRRPPSTYRENDTRAVYTFRASDPQRGAIQWSVTGTDAGDFAITRDSSGRGVLTFVSPPDFENPADGNRDNAYEIAVVATDDENHTDMVAFTIDVTDINEGPEISLEDTATTSVPENHPDTQVLANYTARDPENPDAGIFRWRTAGRDGGDFVISDLGELRFRSSPDYERPADANRDNVYEVTVRASDGRSYGMEETLTVKVTEVNEAPVITTKSRTEFSLRENSTSVLYTYRAADQDNDDVITWSVEGTDGEDFAIYNGILTFRLLPDFEIPVDSDEDNVYEITVVAADSAGLRDTVSAVITITDQPEGPVLAGRTAFTVSENYDITQVLGAYTATDVKDNRPVFPRWSLSGRDGGDFAINEAGQLTFRKPPDFERPADSNRDNTYEVTIRAHDSRAYGNLNVTVTVTDLNEAPEFRSGSKTSFTYRENGTSALYTYRATDPEQGELSWTVRGRDADDFAIGATGVLSFARPPDFDSPSGSSGADGNEYLVTVVVTDDGTYGSEGQPTGPPLERTLEVTVTVTDVNEGPEVSGTGTFTIDENQNLSNAVYRATDPEDPGAAITRWSVSGRDGGDFAINEAGQLTFRKPPDFERPADSNRDNTYELTVRASDGRVNGTFDVTVVVVDVNEAPEFRSGSKTSFTYRENGTSALYTYRATDPEQGELSWSLRGRDADDFAIGATGVLSFARPPDFDSPSGSSGADGNEYLVTVVVTDDGTYGSEGQPTGPPLERTLEVTVTVTDVNEGPEVAGQQSLTVDENHDRVLSTYSATDPEDPGAAITRWSVSGRDGGDFAINEAGQLTFRKPPDFERPADSNRDNTYELTVRASDGRVNGTFDVTVVVEDVNEAPEFRSGSKTSFTYRENGTSALYTYRATDPEQGELSWTVRGRDAEDFAIGATGVLSFARPPDFDSPAGSSGADGNLYLVTVVVTDDGTYGSEGQPTGPPLERTLEVTVTVTDVNEGPEVAGQQSLTVDENHDRVLSTYSATDPEDPGAAITRWSVSGRDGGDFTITDTSEQTGQNTAELTFRNVPDYDRPADANRDNEYVLTIRAYNGSTYGSLDVTVTVTDQNEAEPEVSGRDSLRVSENFDRTLHTYRARDMDLGTTFVWSVRGADGGDFLISDSGALTFSSTPNYERPADADFDNVYEITIVASDGTHEGRLDVSISVTDVNEVPVIEETSANTAITVRENHDQVLSTYSATDPEDPGAEITRWSVSGRDGGDFTVNEGGELALTPDADRPADANRDNVYEVTIRAHDSRAYGNLNVTVTVTDVNEPPTITTISTSATSLRQNENRTSRLYTYRATDPDNDDVITWSVGGTDRSHFTIDERGQFSFNENNPPDFDKPGDVDGDNVYKDRGCQRCKPTDRRTGSDGHGHRRE